MHTLATSAPLLLTASEVARRLRVHRASVYRMIDDGRLRAYRLGGEGGPLRVSEEALDLLLRETVPVERKDARPHARAAAVRRGLQAQEPR